jgi:hypothetical protein
MSIRLKIRKVFVIAGISCKFLYTTATNTKRNQTILTPVGAIFFGLFTFILMGGN